MKWHRVKKHMICDKAVCLFLSRDLNRRCFFGGIFFGFFSGFTYELFFTAFKHVRVGTGVNQHGRRNSAGRRRAVPAVPEDL